MLKKSTVLNTSTRIPVQKSCKINLLAENDKAPQKNFLRGMARFLKEFFLFTENDKTPEESFLRRKRRGSRSPGGGWPLKECSQKSLLCKILVQEYLYENTCTKIPVQKNLYQNIIFGCMLFGSNARGAAKKEDFVSHKVAASMEYTALPPQV